MERNLAWFQNLHILLILLESGRDFIFHLKNNSALISVIYCNVFFTIEFLKCWKKLGFKNLICVLLTKSEMIQWKIPAYLKSFIVSLYLIVVDTTAWWLEIVIVVVNFVRWHQWTRQWTGLQIYLLPRSFFSFIFLQTNDAMLHSLVMQNLTA